MSRRRTGHGPNDWSEPDEGVPAFLSGSAYVSGELVRGEADTRSRRYDREYKRRVRAKAKEEAA